MNTIVQLTKHFRELHFGGNWTDSDLKSVIMDITWQEATQKVESLNTIAVLVFHINYYTSNVLNVFEGQPLDAKDSESFDLPDIQSPQEWDFLKEKALENAEIFASHLEKIPETKLWEIFVHEKYGTLYRNIQGIIEHSYYHLGQIVILKKLVRSNRFK